MKKFESPTCGIASGFLLITVAGEHGETRILGEAGIGEREITEYENGAARGFEAAGVEAIGAQAVVATFGIRNFGRSHRRRSRLPPRCQAEFP
jgi:hypothetical protein